MSRRLALLATALLVASGCVSNPGGPTKPAASATRKPSGGKASPAPQVTQGVPKLPDGVDTRVLGDELIGRTRLTGKVKLVSDHGGALISNNTGNLVANNGGSLISDGGGGLVSDAGGGLIGRTRYAVAQASAAPDPRVESTLVDATVYVHDARGKALTTPDGKPIAAVSDAQGNYVIDAALPPENLVLRVRLWNGGELAAILPRAEAKEREVPIDTAATLGATYVLTQYVKGDPATFEKLPAAEADRLRRDLDAARGMLGKKPEYTAEALVALTDELRAKAPAVDQTLTDIKALLLGQANLGGGRKALQVPLADPRALVADGAGYLVSEGIIGRIRRVGADGTITTFADQLHGEIKANFYGAYDMARAADGTLYVVSGKGAAITRVAPDGTFKDVAGTAQPGRGEPGKPGPEVAMKPFTLWLDPDGTLWIGEDTQDEGVSRVLALGTDGVVREPAPPAWGGSRIVGLARAGDGALYALCANQGGQLWKLPAGGSAWSLVDVRVAVEKLSDLAPAPDGGLFLSEDQVGRVSHLALDGTRTVLSDAAEGAALKRPAEIQVLPDGRLRVIDAAAIRIYEVTKDGAATPVAGTGPQSGDLSGDNIALNGPFAAVYGPAGKLFVSEAASHSVKRWDGKDLTTYAGSLRGDGGDDGAATSARLNQPAGLVFRGDDLLIVDQANRRIRAVSPDGRIRSVVGGMARTSAIAKGQSVPAAELGVSVGAHLARGADGSIYWSSVSDHQLLRLSPAGMVTVVAGAGKGSAGDAGPAADAKLNTPVGIAVGPDGHLYVADVANMRVRRVKDPAGPAPTIEAVAGLDGPAAFGKLAEPAGASEPAAEAAFALPGALCFDAAGNLYVAEFGTLSLPLLATIAEGVRSLPTAFLPKVPARVRKITPQGVVSVVAGPGGKFFSDPEAGDALVLPTSLVIDPQGRLVIVDAGANLIRFLPAGSY